MKKRLKGRAWKFGHHIHGDQACRFAKNKTIPLEDKKALANICMIGYDPDFPRKATRGDFIIGGKNFGWGHLHAHFYGSIKALGISALIVESMNDRCFREFINQGIPVLLCPELKSICNGEKVEVDLEHGKIVLMRTGGTIETGRFPPLLKEIIERRGIDAYIKSKLTA